MKHGHDILGLSFDSERLGAARVAAAGTVARLSAPLSVDPLAGDPQLVAQELRERLQPLGRPARTAVVCLPLNRVMITTVLLPELPEDAVPGFLLLQAEREFLLPPTELAIGISRYAVEGGQRGALLVGLPVSLYRNLQRALRLTGVKQTQITVSAVARPAEDPTAAPGAFLTIDPGAADFGVTAGGGILQLRRLSGTPATADSAALDLPTIFSEVRITLGQLPTAVRRGLRTVELQGAGAPGTGLAGTPVPGLPAATWHLAPAATADGAAGDALTERAEAAARCVAAGQSLALPLAPIVAAQPTGLLQRWTRRQILTAAAGPLLLFLLVTGLVLAQHLQIARLRTRWQAVEPRTVTIRHLMAEAKLRRAWMNDQPESLVLLRALSEAFPKRGTVWATRLEIRDRVEVTLAGKAANREAWLQMLDALRRMPGVANLRVADARDSGDGRSPLTFALGFRWQPVALGPSGTAPATGKE